MPQRLYNTFAIPCPILGGKEEKSSYQFFLYQLFLQRAYMGLTVQPDAQSFYISLLNQIL